VSVIDAEAAMSQSSLTFLLTLAVALGCAAPAGAQTKAEPPRDPAGTVTYESVAEGVHAAQIFGTDALRGVRVEVKDFILGPGRSAPETSVQGFGVTELKSGEVETTIDGQTKRRRPGDFWVVGPGQRYAIRNLAGMVVLHAVIFTRR
jgi:quercetin dioxygenase-like cupin family protein